MSTLQRRGFLTGALAVGGAAATTAASGSSARAAEPAADTEGFGALSVRPGDPAYETLANGVINQRFPDRPERICPVNSTADVVAAVQEAVRDGRRVQARSGGHCFEGFHGDPGVRTLLDLAEMNNVYYDAEHRAIAVEAGARLGPVYQTLFKVFDATIPAGSCPGVGVGGHVIGGGYGIESRQLGSVVDYIHGVEVVVVDGRGRARPVVATRAPGDPHRDLWWAHTGGGGGNFGVTTRVLLRAPDARGRGPAGLLPTAAPEYLTRALTWKPGALDSDAGARVLRNYGGWHERNSAPGAPGAQLCPVLTVTGATAQEPVSVSIAAIAVHPERPDTQRLFAQFVAAVTAGVAAKPSVADEPLPLMARSDLSLAGQSGRFKVKAAMHRRGFTSRQLAATWRHLSAVPGGPWLHNLVLHSYGGQVNAVAPTATATAQRDSIFKAIYTTAWAKPDTDAAALTAARRWYGEVYAATGGAPVPNAVTDGSYINYPDVDLADPRHNTSGVPWSTLYYGPNYPRLQRVKARWDPRNVFRHPLSIQRPG